MANSYFQFKQFRIEQSGAGMKVGADGVLLGAWADITEKEQILDIGTGSGLIALMAAQRTNLLSNIDAVEIDTKSYQQAVNNLINSKFHSKIKAYNISFQDFCKKTESYYDKIISNPPFFINSQQAKDKARNLARHTHQLPFEDLITGAEKLLKPTGTLSVILPVAEGDIFCDTALQQGFYIKRKTAVLPNPGKPAKRFLLEFSLKECQTIFSEITIENGTRHQYTEEYIQLTKDFYLKF